MLDTMLIFLLGMMEYLKINQKLSCKIVGMYLTNIDKYFKEFNQSVLIYPLRDLMGYVAAEKVRYARRFFGSRRFAFPQLPNYFVKKFNHYDIEAQIKGWLCALTRVRILQEKYNKNNQFIVYSHNELTANSQDTMKKSLAYRI